MSGAGDQGFPGAYGFRLAATEPGVDLPHLSPVGADAEVVQISSRHAVALHDARDVGPDRVVLSYRQGGAIVVRREPAEVELYLPQPLPPAALVHPIGTVPLSVLAHWRGSVTLHGGAFVHGGSAWAICGDREAGKSTMLAQLGELGLPIVADDLIVVDGADVLAGPRCVDLRPDVAHRFPSAESMGTVGSRERFRLVTAPSPPRVPLAGIFVLEWSVDGETEATPLELQERLALLHEQQYSTLFENPGAEGIMGLLDVPMLRFRRPRDWHRAAESADALVAAARGQ